MTCKSHELMLSSTATALCQTRFIMDYNKAVAECMVAFASRAPAWPAPLIRFLDLPPDIRRVFGWIVRCTRRLLNSLGELTPELDRQLAMLWSYVEGTPDLSVVHETLERLWVLRSPHETVKTAVVQMFGSLLRYREHDTYRLLACTTSIAMLVDVAPDRERALEEVL